MGFMIHPKKTPMYILLRLLLGASVLFAASFAGCVASADVASERPVLRAVYGKFYPYGFTDADGEAQGFAVDVTQHLADIAGYDVDFIRADNPKQFLDMLALGQVDLTPFLSLTPERRAAGLATASLGAYVLSVYVRYDSEVIEIADLAGRRIGVEVGSVTSAAAARLEEVTLAEFQTRDALLLPLLNGEVDAVVEVSEPFEALLRDNFIEDKVRRLELPLATTPYGIIVRKDLPRVHAALEAAIAQSGTVELVNGIRTHWFGTHRSLVDYPWFERVALIVFGIALSSLSLGVYAIRLRRSSAILAVESGTNQLLIDAFDHMRAAIAVFDADMRAVHWNSAFDARFPEIRATLERGATLEQVCVAFYRSGIITSNMDEHEINRFAARNVQKLKEGLTDQRIVRSRTGDSFDQSIFPLGQRYFAAIWMDMTEVHYQKQQLADQSHELVLKNQQLSAFSAMAAHDLKAPLVQQKMLMEFIAEDLIDAKLSLPTEAKCHFATLSDLSGRMSSLVSDLLDYAKADTQQGGALCFSPHTRLEGVIKLAAPNLKINVMIMPDIPAVHVDPTCFDMVMRNLIANAVKHHDRQTGTITLRGYCEADQVVIEIEDDGPGIKRTDQARVFEPFARLTNVEGTGLGLAFVKRTVAAWGGHVTLRSAPVRGCVFSVYLPAATANIEPFANGIAPASTHRAIGV